MLRVLAALPLPLTLLVHAGVAHAAAGGGSSGYGGGGGGGGFSGGGSGGSYSGSGSGGGVGTLLIVVAIILFFLVSTIVGVVAERRRRRRRDARAALVRAAAAEAAEDDAAFEASTVEAEARRLFTRVQAAWTARDVDALAGLCGEDLLVEWRRRLKDFERKGWHNKVLVQEGPQVHYVGLVNRAKDEEDRVVVLVEATLDDFVEDRHGRQIKRKDDDDTTVRLREYWTLGKRDGRWILLSIEQLGEGDHHLEAAIVASPWGDDRLRDEALVETASADAAPDAADVGSLVDLDLADDARAAALDLSLVDARFSPDVLEAAARRAIEAWADAVDGSDDALLEVAAPDVVQELLYPRGDRARVVVRGPKLRSMTLVRLDGEARPPSMVVELELEGRRYLEDRDTVAVLEGSRERVAHWRERWSFALDGADATPWRLASARIAATDGAV
ncbi:MAG TPA: TIM44-like domain-containing protein [Capillimicrobium sp.]|nr:TIM44-like domain-containing protein [Capillimicrobium sp.]